MALRTASWGGPWSSWEEQLSRWKYWTRVARKPEPIFICCALHALPGGNRVEELGSSHGSVENTVRNTILHAICSTFCFCKWNFTKDFLFLVRFLLFSFGFSFFCGCSFFSFLLHIYRCNAKKKSPVYPKEKMRIRSPIFLE